MVPVDAGVAAAGLRVPLLSICGDEFSKWQENLGPLRCVAAVFCARAGVEVLMRLWVCGGGCGCGGGAGRS